MVSFGLAWCSLVRSRLEWCRLVRSGLERSRLVMAGLVWSGLVSFVRNGVVLSGLVWNAFRSGVAWCNLDRSGLKSSGHVMSGLIWSSLVSSGLERYCLDTSRLEWYQISPDISRPDARPDLARLHHSIPDLTRLDQINSDMT